MAENTIHLVDDDDAVRDSLGALLEAHGFAVRTYASGLEFLNGDHRADIGCLVLDLHLPQMGGFELMQECVSRRIPLPVILITGRTDSGIRRRAADAGVVVLDKPFTDQALLSAISAACAPSARAHA